MNVKESTKSDFHSVWVKIRHADDLLNQFTDLVAKHYPEPNDLKFHIDCEGVDNDILWVEIPPQSSPTDKMSNLVGDVFVNLRSSLEYLMQILVKQNGQIVKNPRDILFPISVNEKAFDDNKVWKYLDEKTKSILAGYKPWDGGSSPLFALHDFSNNNKHRDLLPIAAKASVSADVAVVPRLGFNSFEGFPWQPTSSGRINVVSFSKGQLVKKFDAVSIQVNVAFEVIPNHSAEEVMRDISRHVKEIVRRFDPSPPKEEVGESEQREAKGVRMMIEC